MTNEELKTFIEAIKIAVDEAESWYDDGHGWQKGKKLSELAPCYALLEKYGLKTNMEVEWDQYD